VWYVVAGFLLEGFVSLELPVAKFRCGLVVPAVLVFFDVWRYPCCSVVQYAALVVELLLSCCGLPGRVAQQPLSVACINLYAQLILLGSDACDMGA